MLKIRQVSTSKAVGILTNSPKEYRPAKMPKYDVDVNHTWTLKIPRFTSDHLNLSSRSSAWLSNHLATQDTYSPPKKEKK